MAKYAKLDIYYDELGDDARDDLIELLVEETGLSVETVIAKLVKDSLDGNRVGQLCIEAEEWEVYINDQKSSKNTFKFLKNNR